MPKRSNHLSVDTGVGADPVKRFLASCSPKPDFIFFLMSDETKGIDSKTFNFFCGNLPNIPCWNLVHIRGTPKNAVGLVSAKFCAKVSKLSAKDTIPPEYKLPISTNKRSAM